MSHKIQAYGSLTALIAVCLPGAPLQWPQEVWRSLAAQNNPALLPPGLSNGMDHQTFAG